jgi:hypothetical protein
MHHKLVGEKSDMVSEQTNVPLAQHVSRLWFCLLVDKASKGEVSTFTIIIRKRFPTLDCSLKQNFISSFFI